LARWLRRSARLPVRLFVAGLAIAGAAGATPAPQTLRFARHADVVATLDLAALRTLTPSRTVRVFDPYEGREVAFEALALDAVLDAVYTPAWRSEEEILFTCSDGYQPTVPTRRFQDHAAWLAYARADAADFRIEKRESGRLQSIDVGPFYLVWENLESETLRQDAAYGWPYQVVGIELIRAADRFPEMAPPPGASDDARDGFAAFRVHCSRCHAVNGEGGRIGPELNQPVSPLDYRSADWLRSWIDDPSASVPTARMPRLNPALPDRDRTIDALIAYLDAMRTARPAAGVGEASSEANPDGS